ncbi:hypothetical protein [Lentilactobacillus parakefiri]|uniref:Uncharacterized protein n=1 Tax=Lentilactobacillus parakefiri TaxID=152332 RepID=A0A269YDW5_9LACO|nr:hypothetical protein [Lentilactobacillus parakefiri]PAK83649.1 hypothetical protein B8W98_06155 [Lentilactobacillus parakefiri]
MLENLRLCRSTYLIFIAWGATAFFLASVIFKFQPLTVNVSINDGRLFQVLLRGILLLAAYVIVTILPTRIAIVIPSFFYFDLLGSYLWQFLMVALNGNWRGIAMELLFVISYIVLIYCTTMTAFQIIDLVQKNRSVYYFSKWFKSTKRVLAAHWLSLLVVVGVYVVLWSMFDLI